MPIVLFPADVRLIYFDNSLEHPCITFAGFTDTLEYEPRGMLFNPDLFRQLERRDSLASRQQEVHRIKPLVQRNMRPPEDGSGSHGEVQTAAIAHVKTGLPFACRDVYCSLAFWAADTAFPQPAFYVYTCAFFVGELLKQLESADS